MAHKSYTNEINEIEVSIAVQRLLVAEYPQTWTPTKINLDSLPSGFVDLGAVVEDSPSIAVTREKFQLQTGIPRVLQYEAVLGLSGTLELALHSNSWRKVQYAFGNVSAVSSTTAVGTISSVTNQTVFTVSSTTALQSVSVGRQIVIAGATADFDKADAIETEVGSITSDGLTVACKTTPIRTPTAGDFVGIYDYVQQYIGTSQLRNHVLLAVADFIDGGQVVHHFFKVSPGDEFNEEFRPEANQRIPLSFNAFGVKRSDVPGLSTDELVIARRVYFPRGV